MSDNTRTRDQATFETLYEQKHERLVAAITGMVKDHDQAKDIAAKAFQTAWEKRAQFRGDSSLATWLYAIGFNAARQSLRRDRTVHGGPADLQSRVAIEPH